MALLLKQSTQVVISFGPALLFSDGVSLVTNLVGTGANQTENTSTGIRISKNGGALAARAATATASTYDAFGNYLVTLKTGDTDTLGILRVQYANAAAFCPIWQDFIVVAANIYDSLVGGGDVLDVSVIQLLGTAWLTPGTAGTPDVNAKLLGATAQTGRDIGASVLLSSGAGTGQLDFTSGVVKASLAQILGTAITGTAAQLAAAFTKFFDKASPTGTINSLPDAVPDAVGGLPVTGTRLTALGDTRIANLDAAVSSRSTYAGGAVSSVTAAVTLNNVQGIKKNTALANWPFMMYDSAGLPKTGLQASLRTAGNSQRRLDAGAFADLANIATITEIANGWYTLDFAAEDLNGNTVALRLSATGAADTNLTITTVQA